jgi:hypothetical protein
MSDTSQSEVVETCRAWDSERQCWVYAADVKEAVAAAVSAARLLFGEPEYTYHKKQVVWRSREKSHFVDINVGPQITREEYEANATQSALNETARFMGRLKQTYWRYERKQVAPAWREKLLELVPKYPD